MRIKEIRVCEAPTHVEDCSGIGSTQDHMSPRCLIKQASNVFPHRDNFQFLSTACHLAKDKDNELRAQVLRSQIAGVSVSFQQHLQIFLGAEYVEKYRRLIA